MTDDTDPLLDALVDLIPNLLGAMDAVEQVQRNMHPPWLTQFADFVRPVENRLQASARDFLKLTFPEHLQAFKNQLDQGITYALRACDGITQQT
ncbi:MAG: hypothetical protein OEZ23_07365, partial [Gammaproteobacteria bacterium]|nr:hypothetical protein [Gammaproteobacteria bacterium]